MTQEIHSMADAVDARSITLDIREGSNGANPHGEIIGFPNVKCYTITILCNGSINIGYLKSQLLKKSVMGSKQPNSMWEECQAFDAAHAPDTKLHKVENYLSNECFSSEKEAIIDRAEWILFIEEAYLKSAFRGRGISLLAIDKLIETLALGESCVVLLQAGPINAQTEEKPSPDLNVTEAYEKIAKHWRRMGFDEWSYTDDAWLCLSTARKDRPQMEDVVPALYS